MDEQTAERLDGIGLRDHSVTAEYRIFGPPGICNTTNLTRQIQRAADRFGESSVRVASFSKATAAELTSRDTPMDLDRIGTLHSHLLPRSGRTRHRRSPCRRLEPSTPTPKNHAGFQAAPG